MKPGEQVSPRGTGARRTAFGAASLAARAAAASGIAVVADGGA